MKANSLVLYAAVGIGAYFAARANFLGAELKKLADQLADQQEEKQQLGEGQSYKDKISQDRTLINSAERMRMDRGNPVMDFVFHYTGPAHSITLQTEVVPSGMARNNYVKQQTVSLPATSTRQTFTRVCPVFVSDGSRSLPPGNCAVYWGIWDGQPGTTVIAHGRVMQTLVVVGTAGGLQVAIV